MIKDFNKEYKENIYKYYDGRNGSKICLEDQNGQKYMLKTPPSKNSKYTNGCVS